MGKGNPEDLALQDQFIKDKTLSSRDHQYLRRDELSWSTEGRGVRGLRGMSLRSRKGKMADISIELINGFFQRRKDYEEEGNLIPSSSYPAVVDHFLSNLVQGSREDGVPLQEGRKVSEVLCIPVELFLVKEV